MFFALIGPGIITSNVDNDAGGITTYSLAGSEYGLTLLWTLIPITGALIIIQEMCARMGVVSGKGLSDLIRERFGARITFYLMIVLFLTNLGNTISEFAGVAASLEIFGVSKYISVPISAAIVWWLVVKGNYKSVEKVFLFACVFYLSYIISGFMGKPDWHAIGSSFLKPTIRMDTGWLTMAVGVIGTTIAPWMQFYLQSSVVDKGLKAEDYPYTRMDVIIGSVTVNVVAFFIIMLCAVTLFQNGIRIESAKDAAQALAPLAGEYCLLAVRLRAPQRLAVRRLHPSHLDRLHDLRGLRMGVEPQPQVPRGPPVLRPLLTDGLPRRRDHPPAGHAADHRSCTIPR